MDTRDPRPAIHPPTADVSVLLSEEAPQGLRSTRLFSVSLTAVCAQEHAAAVAHLGSDVFGQMPLIVHRARPFAWAHWAQEIGLASPEPKNPEPKNVIELDTMSAVVRAAERGVGMALVPAVLCDSWFRSGALVRLFTVELATRHLLSGQPPQGRGQARCSRAHALGAGAIRGAPVSASTAVHRNSTLLPLTARF
jgi:DNA-binding transcriptional LysR family regulator